MKVTIIGVGGLGSAIAEGLLASSRDAARAPGDDVELTLCARREASLAPFAGRAHTGTDARAAVVGADVVVLAVKPAGTAALLA